jgi:hypothetical protein
MSALPKLRTPEMVAEELGGEDTGMTGFYVRQLIKDKGLPHRVGRHRKVLMTPDDVAALLEAMLAPAEAAEDEGAAVDPRTDNPFGATGRSAARHGRMAG